MNLSKTDILNIIHLGHPVSITRSGDGEAMVLRSNDSINAYRQCIDNVMKRQMGYEPNMTEVEEIRQNLITAYKGADVVGVPMHSNLDELGKHWTSVQETVEQYTVSDKRCSTDVFYELLYDGSLIEWLRNKPVVNYIGCRDIDEPLRRVLNIGQVNSLIIAPEAKFTSGYDGPRHYPDQFNKVEWWMNNAPCEGVPCLVGAGVIGKIYCNWFRDRGGIGIDIGAVMDLLYGVSTRGPERGIDKPFDKYKL